MATKTDYIYGLGRRKSSTARARLYKGKGGITINDKPIDEYFAGNGSLAWDIGAPLRLLEMEKSYDITVLVKGGGHHGQAGAIRLAIAKALASLNDDLRSTLKKEGLLVRDSREKERQKPGLKGARKKEQFSKR